MILTGCALFGARQKAGSKGAANSPAGQISLSNQGFADSTASSNQVTATIASENGITLKITGGKVTAVANGGSSGGSGEGPGGASEGAGTSSTGHGPLFYFYILFGAAVVIWIIWAIWHSYRREPRPMEVR